MTTFRQLHAANIHVTVGCDRCRVGVGLDMDWHASHRSADVELERAFASGLLRHETCRAPADEICFLWVSPHGSANHRVARWRRGEACEPIELDQAIRRP